ncbi:unnamed protein product [Microthlaspi erraticum]|uniref:Uncharacterized protein n=1 Tax=Microthlaspi erraticum TaxID=1685480 RepID=A0A6D2IIN7_9BRAS|nr:unnamed protein product [Microthlaspi erraticum]
MTAFALSGPSLRRFCLTGLCEESTFSSCDVTSMLMPDMSDVSQAKESMFSFRKAISSILIEPLSSEPMFTHLSGCSLSRQTSCLCWGIRKLFERGHVAHSSVFLVSAYRFDSVGGREFNALVISRQYCFHRVYPGSAQYSVIWGWAISYDEACRFSDSSRSNYELDGSKRVGGFSGEAGAS